MSSRLKTFLPTTGLPTIQPLPAIPNFRFYAGAPVIDPDGFALGSVCVMDYVPRKLDRDEKQTLLALAAVASNEVRLRATDRQLRWAQTALEHGGKR
jgi:GAF domain-containing protein